MIQTSVPFEKFSALKSALANRYAIERELGRGGMAVVFLARDLERNTNVALKVLLPELAASLGADRFLREIELGTTLQHPNIVGVFDSGSADGLLYYTMPYIEGESLRERLNRQQQLAIDETISITRQVASALAFAHERGIIHRDIKPENILLDKEQAWVADFGIARAVSVAGGETLTRTGMAVGTPTYMSPEQAAGSREVTAQSDIYSLACVVYEMLAGQPPFTGPTAMALLARHSLEHVPSIRIVRSAIPESIEDALLRALEKTPADRFATATEFAGALADDSGQGRKRPRRGARTATRSTKEFTVGRGSLIMLAAVPVVLGAAWLGWRSWRGADGGAAVSTEFPPNNIAVLYFTDRSAGKELQHLADGLTESLIDELGQVGPALSVISRNGVAPFKGTAVLSDSIARTLKVGTIVEGSVAQSGDRLRVKVALVDAPTGKQIGSTTLDQAKADLFELQDSLAKEVSLFLRERLGQEIGMLKSRAGTRNAQAWEALQRAKQIIAEADPLLATGGPKAASARLAAADSALAKLESLDPKWAAPITQRGWLAYRQSRLGSFDKTEYSKWIDEGLGHANRALALAPKDPDVLELRGTLHYWQWLLNLAPDPAASAKLLNEAEADLRAATELNKLQASAFNSLSHMMMAKSKTGEAKLAALSAYSADPYLTDANRTLWRLFWTNLDLGDRFEAEKWCAEGRRRFEKDFRFTECRLWLQTLPGKKPTPDSIWAAYRAFVDASPPQLRDFHKLKGGMAVAVALIRAGLPDSARSVATRSHGNPEIDPARELVQWESIVRAQLGENDEALRLLRQYLAAAPQYRAAIAQDETWWYGELRSDPRYIALARGG